MPLYVVIICIIISILSTFIICLNIDENNQEKNQIPTENNFTPTNTIVNSETPTPIIQNSKKVISSWEEFNFYDIPLIASIPEKEIFLYGIKPNSGVILKSGDRSFYYDWAYLTPRFILPEIFLNDFDKDDQEELAVILYIGSGTGVSVEELHIIEISEDENFKDYLFKQDDYLSQIDKLVEFKSFTKNNKTTAELIIDEKVYPLNLDEQEKDNSISGTVFSNIVRFSVDDGKINAEFGVGIGYDSFPTPVPVGTLHADVLFRDGEFTLKNIKPNPTSSPTKSIFEEYGYKISEIDLFEDDFYAVFYLGQVEHYHKISNYKLLSEIAEKIAYSDYKLVADDEELEVYCDNTKMRVVKVKSEKEVIEYDNYDIETAQKLAMDLVIKELELTYIEETDEYSKEGISFTYLLKPFGFDEKGRYEVRISPSYYSLSVLHYCFVDLKDMKVYIEPEN